MPDLAEEWSANADGTEWTFSLRRGVTFHDGTPLTPEAVVTALRYVAGVEAPPRAIRDIGFTIEADGPDADAWSAWLPWLMFSRATSIPA